jgi:hypothetical protein
VARAEMDVGDPDRTILFRFAGGFVKVGDHKVLRASTSTYSQVIANQKLIAGCDFAWL